MSQTNTSTPFYENTRHVVTSEDYVMEVNSSYGCSSVSSMEEGNQTIDKHHVLAWHCHLKVLYLISALTVVGLAALCICTTIMYAFEYTNMKIKFNALDNLTENLSGSMIKLHRNTLGRTPGYPAESCASILQSVPESTSGYYWLRFSNGPAVRAYCDMTRVCGGLKGGWMRVADIDIQQTSAGYPPGYQLRMEKGSRVGCVIDTHSGSCRSSWFSTLGFKSSRVCGSVLGYQFGTVNGFNTLNTSIRDINPSIDSNYVDGISLTYGQLPRKHIWTFAAGGCPCEKNRPSFLRDDFYCGRWRCKDSCSVDTSVWIGFGICQSQQPDWFFKEIAEPTTSIEMRACRDEDRNEEDFAFQTMKLYVQ